MASLGFGFGLEKVRRYAGGTPAPAPITRVTQEGDSITAYAAPTSDSASKYSVAWALANPSLTVTNLAVTSAGIGSPADAPGTNSLFGRKADMVASNPEALTILIGANDLSSGTFTTIDGSGPAATDWLTRLFEYIAYARANVPGLQKVLVAGVLPVDPARWPNGVTLGNTHNTRRATVNALLRAAVGNQIDGYIPFGDAMADALATDTLYFGDGLHPSHEGRRLMQRIFNAVLNPLIAGATGNTPSAFNLINQTNVALGGTATAETVVTGMGLGQTATASVTGGLLARGAGSFGAGSVTVCNGDIPKVQATVSGSNGVATDVTLAVGSQSDVFTATSAASTNVEFEHSTDVRLTHDSFVAGESTFNAVTFPAGRPVVMVKKPGNNESGVIINGVAATRVTADTTAQHSLWIGPPSQNLTAGTYEVKVQWPSVSTSCTIYPGAIRNCAQAVASMTSRVLPLAYYADIYLDPPPPVEIGSGGLMLFALRGIGSTFDSFVNGTSVHAYAAESGYVARWGTSKVSGVPAIYAPGGSGAMQQAMIVVELKQVAADSTAPTLSSPTDAANGANAMTGSVSTNEGNGTLYWFVSTSATPPTASSLKAGTGAAAFGSQAVTATGVQNITASGLTAGTVYYTHFLHSDETANDSAIATADGFTTVDNVPSAFSFTDVTGADLSTLYTSNTITLAGFDVGVSLAVSVTGGEYSKNGGAWTSTAGTASVGDTFAVRATSSGSEGTATNVTLTVGTVSDTYTITSLSSSFNPATLFTGGRLGFAMAADEIANHYQDSAGTTGAAVGQPIGSFRDVYSGGGNHFTQATSGSRPTLLTHANGHNYVKFDGSNDHLFRTTGIFANAGGSTLIFGVLAPSLADSAIYAEGSSASTTPFYRIAPSIAGEVGKVRVSMRDDANTSIPTKTTVGTPMTPSTGVHIVTVFDDGTNIRITVDGTVQSITPSGNYSVRGTITNNRMAMGALVRSVVSSYSDVGIFAALCVDDTLSGTELTDAVNWVASKTNL